MLRNPPQVPTDELRDAHEARLKEQLRQIAWEHVQAAHARFLTDTADGRTWDAFHESQLVLKWFQEHQALPR